jgi:hypothetical protein
MFASIKRHLHCGALAGSLGLALLSFSSSAQALTYVPLVDGPGKAMASGPVDIDVYYSVRDSKTGKTTWLKHTLTGQRDIGPANNLIQKLMKEGHQVTIGWRRQGK